MPDRSQLVGGVMRVSIVSASRLRARRDDVRIGSDRVTLAEGAAAVDTLELGNLAVAGFKSAGLVVGGKLSNGRRDGE